MPRVRVASPSAADIKAHPREYALVQLLSDGQDGFDCSALVDAAGVYGDAAAVRSLVGEGEVPFDKLAAALAKPGQLSAAEGDAAGNCLGWAARDSKGVLAPLRFKRRDPGPLDVVIQITHAGMCHSDLHTIRGDWGAQPWPVVPGHEIVGIVTAVGDQVTKFKVGDRAGVGVMVDSCRDCRWCNRADEQFCSTKVFTYSATNYDGLQAQGGYSTHIVTAERFTYTLPANVPMARLAPLLCAGITTWSPYVDYGLNKPGLKIGVNGLGGLGHMAVKFGVAFGCEVTVISRSKAKEADALALGAARVIASSDAEEMKAAAGTFDGIIDTVSAPHDINALLNLLAPRGRVVQVGLPPGSFEVNHFGLVINAKSYSGSCIGGTEETQRMLDFCGEHGIGSDVQVIDIDEANAAYERMEKGQVKFRFVIDVGKSLIA